MPIPTSLNCVGKREVDECDPSSAKPGSGNASTAPTYYKNLLSVEVRLIRAMDEAVDRERRVEAGEHVRVDSVEWWRCPPGRPGKLVVYPAEHCRDKFLPYPYPKEGEVHRSLHVTSASFPSATIAPAEDDAFLMRRKRGSKRAVCKRILFFLFLFVLLILNLAALVWCALVAVFWKEGEIPLTIPLRLPSIPYFTITIRDR